MPIDYKIYDTQTLLGVFRDKELMEPVNTYWLDLGFPSVFNSEDEYIDFSMLTDQRKLAPFVVPTAQGKPIASRGEKVGRFKPAYIKPKDAIGASRVLKRHAKLGELGTDMSMLSPQQRYNMLVAQTVNEHNKAIRRRWDWMAAQAILYGAVTVEGEAFPKTVVDFQRDPAHTIIKAAGSRWGDAGVSIIKDIEDWASMMRRAKYGGPVTRITLGTKAFEAMRKDPEIKEMMNLQNRATRDSGVNIDYSILGGTDIEYVGKVSDSIDVYVYRGFYHDPAGNVVEIMDPRDVVLTSPAVQGVRAFGAIQDVDARFRPLAIFPKMWREQDPSGTFIMSQSAPLPVPVFPNATLRAQVVA